MFAETPAPPYTAVIFTSQRTGADDAGYDATAQQLEALAGEQPGFLGIESARDPGSRLGITVSYWATEADAAAWKEVADHAAARQLGRERWYARFEVRIATVTRAYGRAAGARAEASAEARGGAP